MSAVAEKPPKSGKRGRGRPPSEKPLRNHIGVKLPDDLALSLQEYREILGAEITEPAVIRTALKFFFEAKGCYPPKRKQAKRPDTAE